ncbi:neutral zinc metallopeptidase [Nocardiopsis ansamitocini]|uniref:neutral zinc metallopeptidase n=1 Tax=Nocardiopsis ansamitocini TaxID=1670832 RepID=UPI002556312F|nr:neutral zinc metallopeptidase [Nocardiopsis ansamitocini]
MQPSPPGHGQGPWPYAAHPASGYGPWAPQPSQPRPLRRGLGLWLTAGGSAFAAVVSLVLCVGLMVVSIQDGSTSPGKPERPYDSSWYSSADPIAVDIQDHPLYDLSPPAPVDCDVPAFDASSAAEWESFTETVGPCLDAMWNPTMAELGLHPETPSYVVLDKVPPEMEGDDEEGWVLAYYMDYDLTITVLVPSVRNLLPYPNMGDERIWFALLAHEYGHHIQGQTEILAESDSVGNSSTSDNEFLDSSRRVELQAECFAGAAFTAVNGYGADDAEFTNRNFNADSADSTSHGSATNRVHWFDSGAEMETLEACNTFGASKALTK